MKILRITAAACLLTAAMWIGCAEDDPLSPAWNAFLSRDYPAAHALFAEQAPTQGAPAYVGLGWTAMRMGADSLDASDLYFSIAAASDTLVDAFAGWAVLAWVRGEHAACAERIDIVFEFGEDYVFPYDRDIRAQELYLHQAYSYFNLQNYAKCIGSIQKIDPAFALALSDPAIDRKLLQKLQLLSDELR